MKLPNYRQFLIALAAISAFTFSPAAEAQNLLTNGGFEDGFASFTLTPGTFSFAGQNGTFAQSGIGYANLERTGAIGSLSQSVNTIVGQQYSISFFLANDSGVAPNSFAAAFGTSGVAPQFSITNSAAFGYLQFSFNTVATTTTSTLRFDFRHDDDFFRLDTVSVSVIPEPSTNVLMIMSAAGLVGIVRYRRTKAARLAVNA